MKRIIVLFVIFSWSIFFSCNKILTPVKAKEQFTLIVSFLPGYQFYVECVSGDTVRFSVPDSSFKMYLDYYVDYSDVGDNTNCLSFSQVVYCYDTKVGDTIKVETGQRLYYFKMHLQ